MSGWTPPAIAGVRFVNGCFAAVELVAGGGGMAGGIMDAGGGVPPPTHLVPSQD